MREQMCATSLCANNRGERNLVDRFRKKSEKISKWTEVTFYYRSGFLHNGWALTDNTDVLFIIIQKASDYHWIRIHWSHLRLWITEGSNGLRESASHRDDITDWIVIHKRSLKVPILRPSSWVFSMWELRFGCYKRKPQYVLSSWTKRNRC